MYRITLHNLFYDGKQFLFRHRGKFIIAILIAIIGFSLGVTGTISDYDVAILNKFNNFSVVLLISGKKTLVAYLVGRFVQMLALTLILLILSFRLFTAVLGYVVIFFFCFFSARNIAISISIIKVGFLPVTILALVPSIIIYTGTMCGICVISVDYSCENGYYNPYNFFYSFVRLVPSCIPHTIILLITAIVEAILVNILTLGLSV